MKACGNRKLFSAGSKRKKRDAVMHRIGRLTDDILIIILSCLSLKEAVRTSVLSRRWRYLWRFTSGTLDFDLHLWNAKKAGHHTHMRSTEFETLVDQVLELHQAPSVDKFIVRYTNLGYDCHNRICNWIRFAMQKDVRVFDLELETYERYEFPDLDRFLSISREVKPKDIVLSSLTSFTLVSVDITNEMVGYLLSNCPCLQHLCLKYLLDIKSLNIVGPSLRSLIIYYCISLENLVISASNLVSFEFGGSYESGLQVLYQNVPVLSELAYDGHCCRSFIFFDERFNFCDQLEKLVLRVPFGDILSSKVVIHYPLGCLQFARLKELELVLCVSSRTSLIYFVWLTRLCPFLSRFQAQFDYQDMDYKREIASVLRGYGRDYAKTHLKSYRHEYLKVVHLINFACYRCEFRFALSLIKIAKSLEKMIISPGGPRHSGIEKRRIANVRERVNQLEANLPPGAKLLIL